MTRFLLIVLFLLFSISSFGQAPLPTSWGFSRPPVTSPPNGWQLNLGTNGNLTYTGGGFAIGDGVACRLDGTGEFVKIAFADAPGELSYFIRGTGIAPQPSFTGIFSVQESIDDVTYTNIRQFTTASPAPGTLTRFVHNPASSSRYIRFIYTEKLPNSNISLDSVWLKAPGPSPNPGISLAIGANVIVNQGTAVIGNTPLSTFTIRNAGTVQTLTIDSVRFTGPAAGDFSIQGSMPTAVTALGSQNFNLAFNPGANGTRQAQMRIFNNDVNRNPFVVQLYGVGGTLATEPTQAPASLQATNVTSFGMRLALANPTPKPDRYLVLRKMGGPIAEVPVDGTTYRQGDRIGGAVVAYVGDSAFSNLRPTYIFANSQYYFKAFSFNGPAGFENYLTASSAEVNVLTLGKRPGNYYNGINPGVSTFLTDLSAKVNPHDTVFYSLFAARMMSSFTVRDTTNGRKVANCVYTGIPYIYDGGFVWWTGQAGNLANLTREHTFAQSWMPSNNGGTWPSLGGRELPEFNDMHNLFPADQPNANSRRSNLPFGNVVTPTFTSPTGQGKVGRDANGQTVYEPKGDHKGDAARALMYMSVCYNGIRGQNWRIPALQSPAVIMQWHLQDTVSNFEIARHEYIFSQQRNRNPFIDNPSWYSRINFANMTYAGPLGLTGIDFIHEIATYPNPATSFVHVDATLIFTKAIPYVLTDANGKVVKTGELIQPQSTIDLPSGSGLYWLNLHTDKGKVVTRIVRQ